MGLKRFTKAKFLKQVGRNLLGQLFGRFEAELAARKVALPASELEDEAYFAALARVAKAPEGLPDRLFETLFAIADLANEHGQERLEEAAAQAGLALKFRDKSTHGEIAAQVWLAKPELLIGVYNEFRLSRLATFEYFGTKAPVDRSDAFGTPPPAVLDSLAGDLDGWCQQHNRGEQTAHIEVSLMDGEYWFLVRHGDTFVRTAKVDQRRTEMLHFRPAKDDVVVYSPERDEIRIHAETKGEREFYRTAFGVRLLGDAQYFSVRQAYTLAPLLLDGRDALSTEGVPGLRAVVPRDVDIALPGQNKWVTSYRANDLFDDVDGRVWDPTKDDGQLVRASFDFYFDGEKKPRRVEIKTPNILKLGHYCDARLVHLWISKRGFRANANAITSSGLRPPSRPSGEGTWATVMEGRA